MRTWCFDAIGTQWRIGIQSVLDQSSFEDITNSIAQRIEVFDATYSRFRTDSLIARIAEQAGSYEFPEDSKELFDAYWACYVATGGSVTPLIGDGLVALGYDRTYSMIPKETTKPPSWEDVLSFTYPILTTRVPVTLDFGAGGKGYLVDIIASHLTRYGIASFFIDAGGDIVHKTLDDTSFKVGLEDPFDTTRVIGVVNVHNQSICASSGNRRTWRGMHHIVDPFLMQSPATTVATWVVSSSTLYADLIATALFFQSPEKLFSLAPFSYLRIDDHGAIRSSADFRAEYFIAPKETVV